MSRHLEQQHRNLDTAEKLIALAKADHEVELQYAVDLAGSATEHQARALGLDLSVIDTETPHHDSPSEALAALVEQLGGTMDAGDLERVRTLDDLAEPTRTALTQFVDAFAAFSTASELAYADADLAALASLVDDAQEVATTLSQGIPGSGSPPDVAIDDLLATAGIDIGPVLAARDALTEAVAELAGALGESPSSSQQTAAAPIQVGNIFSIDLGLSTTNTYSEDFILLLDAGGNDTYNNNAGGNIVRVTGSTVERCAVPGLETAPIWRAAAAIDFGGNDLYTSGLSCGVNGGGYGGTGFLADFGGSDTYTAGTGGTNGGGSLAGTGFLLDAGLTRDVYTGDNGGTFIGVAGTLIDAAGNDSYAGLNGTSGLGGPAFLYDGLGDDTYTGPNGASFAGSGFLADTAGSDTYTGNNGSTLVGTGFVFDAGVSNDRFTHPSLSLMNGSGIGGVGMLIDSAGNDTYSGTNGAVNGGAEAGVGILIDGTGDDSYTAGSGNVNGGADLGLGLLFDGQGRDVYSDNEGGSGVDKRVIPKGTVGAQVDSGVPPIPPTTTTSIPLPTTTLPTVTTSTLPPITTTSIPPPTTTTSSLPLDPSDVFTGYASNDCDTSPDITVVNRQEGTAYAKLRTKTVGSETWVCLALDGGSGTTHIGGKAIVDATQVPVDDDQGACHDGGVPPFPQHFEGTFGPNDTPVHLDIVTVDDGPGVPSKQLWICVQVDTVAKRLVLPGGLVRFVPDDLDHTDPPTTTTSSTSSTTTSSTTTTTAPPPPLGEPSRFCVDNGGDEVLNEPVGSGRVWVYTHQSGSVTSACVRFETGEGPVVGGRLIVDGDGSQTYVVVEDRDDFTTDPAFAPDGPCNVNVLNITSEPNLIVKLRDPTLGSPAFLCVKVADEARRIRISAPADQSFVTWDADSDSAVPDDNT